MPSSSASRTTTSARPSKSASRTKVSALPSWSVSAMTASTVPSELTSRAMRSIRPSSSVSAYWVSTVPSESRSVATTLAYPSPSVSTTYVVEPSVPCCTIVLASSSAGASSVPASSYAAVSSYSLMRFSLLPGSVVELDAGVQHRLDDHRRLVVADDEHAVRVERLDHLCDRTEDRGHVLVGELVVVRVGDQPYVGGLRTGRLEVGLHALLQPGAVRVVPRHDEQPLPAVAHDDVGQRPGLQCVRWCRPEEQALVGGRGERVRGGRWGDHASTRSTRWPRTPPASLRSLTARRAPANMAGPAPASVPVCGSSPPSLRGSADLVGFVLGGGDGCLVSADSLPAPTYSVLPSSSWLLRPKLSVPYDAVEGSPASVKPLRRSDTPR